MTKEVPCIGNLHVRAETRDNDLIFLYKVEKGICDQSFGIHVAKLAKFPEHIIQNAQNKVKEREGFSGVDETTRQLRDHVLNYIKDMDVDSLSDDDLLKQVSQLRKYVEHKWSLDDS